MMLTPLVPTDRDGSEELTASQLLLKQMVLNSVTAASMRRNYSKWLNDLFAFAGGQPLTRALLQRWESSMGKPSSLDRDREACGSPALGL